jgi:hypothetical protein
VCKKGDLFLEDEGRNAMISWEENRRLFLSNRTAPRNQSRKENNHEGKSSISQLLEMQTVGRFLHQGSPDYSGPSSHPWCDREGSGRSE